MTQNRLQTSDWSNLATTTNALYNYWEANNIDAILHPYYEQMQASNITLANSQAAEVENALIQLCPSLTLQQINPYFQTLVQNAGQNGLGQTIITALQTYGAAPFLQLMYEAFTAMQNVAASGAASPGLAEGETPIPSQVAAIYDRLSGQPAGSMNPAVSCRTWGVIFLFVGVGAFTVGTMGTFGVLEGWGAFAYGFGAASTVGSVAQGLFC